MDTAKVAEVRGQPEEFRADDIITAAALNSGFYGEFFFPQTCKQKAPEFHAEIDDVLDRPENRYVALESYRGSSKTSKLRLFTSKRIAFGVSRTILFISASERHSTRSIQWIARNVEHNKKWAETFQLKRGTKWTESELEIIHGAYGFTVRVIGLGITGQVRGINIDDFRPDLIVVDDPEDEENTATPEQRNKISELFFGAVMKSLVPASENYEAMLAMLQTPLQRDCLIETLMKDPMFVSRRYGCFGPDRTSRWEERFPTKELLLEKEGYIARNKLSIWLREMECKLTDPETASFRLEWLNKYELLPEGLTYFIAIDPAPIRSEAALLKNVQTDYQAVVVIGVRGKEVYLAEYTTVRDQDPEMLGAELLRMVFKYHPRAVGIETVAYQRTLKWYIEKIFKEHKVPVFVREIRDKRKKTTRIRQTITDRAYNRNIWVHRSHVEFMQQFADHPNLSFDDLIDAFSMSLMLVGETMYMDETDEWASGSYKKPPEWRAAP